MVNNATRAYVLYLRPFERIRLLQAVADAGIYVIEREGEEGFRTELESTHPDFVIAVVHPLDPRHAELLSRLREAGRVLVAVLPEPADEQITAALEAGADIWVSDTTERRPLAAQLSAASRQAGIERERAPVPADGLVFHELRLDFGRRAVTAGDRREPLTPTEFAIMRRLFETPDRVVANQELVAQVASLGRRAASTANLKTTIRKLRLKLDSVGGYGRYVRTVRGVGYSLSVE